MRQAYEDICRLQELSGAAALQHLASIKDHESTLQVLKFVFNPYVRTGISTKKLDAGWHALAAPNEPRVARIIEFFTEHQTGSSTDINMAWKFINAFDDVDEPGLAQFVEAVIKQDIQCGVSVTSLNKVFGKDFIPVIGCMLGRRIDQIPQVKWPCVVTEKLDGIRRLVFNQGGAARFYSRSGHEYNGHDEIAEEVVKYLPEGYMYDGELVATGEFKDIIAQRQATMALSALKGTKTGLMFHIFDMVSLAEVESSKFKESAINRKIRLAATFNDSTGSFIDDDFDMHSVTMSVQGIEQAQHIVAVPIMLQAHYEEQIEPALSFIRSIGGEGVMLNVSNAPYKMGRTNDLVKVKFVKEFTLPIVGFIEGQHKYEGMLGALIVDYEGYKVGVGSGFSDYQRQRFWEERSTLIGQLIEVDSFGESTSIAGGKSLNCPIFKRLVGAEE